MKYRLVYGSNPQELMNAVNIFIKDGWKVTGGLVITEGYSFYQAMIKEDTKI